MLTCAATALRASELLALRWADILWSESRIRVSKRWACGKDGKTKTERSDGFVPLHPVLAQSLKVWLAQTPHAKETDFVFPSLKAQGKVPLSGSIFVADHLWPAAVAAGVQIEKGHRFGLHNLRHSLSNWLVNKAKVEPKTVQGILRHSRIQTTLDLYTQQDSDEARAAQGVFLTAIGMSNTDDHLRNGGFLYHGNDGWRLSPAYDLNPVPIDIKPRVLTLAINEEDTTASLAIAMEVAGHFELEEAGARGITAQVARAISRWREVAAEHGISKQEIDRMVSAFEHEDLKEALG